MFLSIFSVILRGISQLFSGRKFDSSAKIDKDWHNEVNNW